MSQYNNIVITPNIGVSSNPNIEFSGIGNTTIKLEYYNQNEGSLLIRSEENVLFSISNEDEENPDLVYAINDDDGTIALSVSSSGITTIRNLVGTSVTIGTSLQTPLIDYLATGAASTTKITTKHYGTDNGYLAFESGISTTHIFSVGAAEENNEVYVINDDDANPVLTVYNDGETGLIRASFASTTVGAASTDKMEISAVSRDNGLLEIANYGGNQLFSVSNNQSESAFSIYRYANYENLSITSFENRNLFSVSPLGIVTTYGALRVGTSNTIADSYVYNELYGRLNVKAPFSTTTEYVSIVPKFSDKGALSFEAPVGTAQTDRGTQIFSISNNLDSSIFRVNDLNRNPIFEASASGNAGFGTTNPQAKLEVSGNLRITSAGSTAGEQIDINHYRNVAYQQLGITTDNRGAISLDGSNAYSGYLGNLLTAVNDDDGTLVTIHRFDSFPGIVTAFNIDYTGAINAFENIKVNGNVDFSGGEVSIARTEKFTFNVARNPGVTTFRDVLTAVGSTYVGVDAVGGGIGGQLITITNDNEASAFQINRNVGVNSLTPVTTGNAIITPSFSVDKYGEVRIYETYPDKLTSPRIAGFQTGNVAIGDGDLFRIDAYSSPFIGSFPTINTALKVDKYGTFDFRRNINQTSGIATVGIATTSTTLSVNATLSFELLDNSTLTVKVRGTDGVTRTGIVTLA